MTLAALEFDDHDLQSFLRVAAAYGTDRYGYVVTPNADHLIRLDGDPGFQALYAGAEYVLNDSRFLAHLVRIVRRTRLPVCAGSDLTAGLFGEVIRPGDRLVLIGARPEQADALRRRFGLTDLHHHDPPMGFVKDPAEVERCVAFAEERSPFRYCLIGVGSPQQEVVARALGERGTARGMALCIGASVDFLTGVERRAPRWMQRIGFEWLFRLLQSPRRLAKRYLVRGPRIFRLVARAPVRLRPARPVAAGAEEPARAAAR